MFILPALQTAKADLEVAPLRPSVNRSEDVLISFSTNWKLIQNFYKHYSFIFNEFGNQISVLIIFFENLDCFKKIIKSEKSKSKLCLGNIKFTSFENFKCHSIERSFLSYR